MMDSLHHRGLEDEPEHAIQVVAKRAVVHVRAQQHAQFVGLLESFKETQELGFVEFGQIVVDVNQQLLPQSLVQQLFELRLIVGVNRQSPSFVIRGEQTNRDQ